MQSADLRAIVGFLRAGASRPTFSRETSIRELTDTFRSLKNSEQLFSRVRGANTTYDESTYFAAEALESNTFWEEPPSFARPLLWPACSDACYI